MSSKAIPVIFAALVAASVGAVPATSAKKATSNLSGEYAFTGASNCVLSAQSFNPITFALINPNSYFSLSVSVEGIRTFNGDGTGTVRATTIVTSPTNTLNAAGKTTFSYNFTYVVNDDGSFTSELVPGTYAGIVEKGNRAGQTYTLDKISLVGLIGNAGSTLTLAAIDPTIQQLNYSGGDVRYRICTVSRVLTLMDKK